MIWYFQKNVLLLQVQKKPNINNRYMTHIKHAFLLLFLAVVPLCGHADLVFHSTAGAKLTITNQSEATLTVRYKQQGSSNWENITIQITESCEPITFDGETLSLQGDYTGSVNNAVFSMDTDYTLSGTLYDFFMHATGPSAAYLFMGDTHLTAVNDLSVAGISDFTSMFEGCTALQTAPALPATTLAANCYEYMFKGCTALTATPTLPATTVPANAYFGMFEGCTALTAVPTLPSVIENLGQNCYSRMFYGCTGLGTTTLDLEYDNDRMNDMFRDAFTDDAVVTITSATKNDYNNIDYCARAWCDKAGIAASKLLFTNFTPNDYLLLTPSEEGTITFRGDCSEADCFYSADNGSQWRYGNIGEGHSIEFTTANPVRVTANINNKESNAIACNVPYTIAGNISAFTSYPYQLFYNDTYLTSAKDLVIDIEIDNEDQCEEMFYGCTVLKDANVAAVDKDYGSWAKDIFFGCTALQSGGHIYIDKKHADSWIMPSSGYEDGKPEFDNSTTGPIYAEHVVVLNDDAPANHVTYTPVSGENITVSISKNRDSQFEGYVTYSTDGGSTWTTTFIWNGETQSLQANSSLCLYLNQNSQYPEGKEFYAGWSKVTTDVDYTISGPFEALAVFPSDSQRDTKRGLYAKEWFKDDTHLVDASGLVLPSDNIAPSCFEGMFQGCTALTGAPNLPAATVPEYGYFSMFKGCTALTVAPDLLATTGGSYCYQYMFSGCTALQSAYVALSPKTSGLVEKMFEGCPNVLLTAPHGNYSDWHIQDRFDGKALNYKPTDSNYFVIECSEPVQLTVNNSVYDESLGKGTGGYGYGGYYLYYTTDLNNDWTEQLVAHSENNESANASVTLTPASTRFYIAAEANTRLHAMDGTAVFTLTPADTQSNKPFTFSVSGTTDYLFKAPGNSSNDIQKLFTGQSSLVSVDLANLTDDFITTTKSTTGNSNILFFAPTGATLTTTDNVVIDGTCANLVLTDKQPFGFPTGETVTATAATYTRTGITSKWGTLTVPFALTPDDTKPYSFYEVSAVSDESITFTKRTTAIAAGTPVLLCVKEDQLTGDGYTLTLNASDAALAATPADGSAAGGLTLTGTFGTPDLSGADGYFIANNSCWSIGDNPVKVAPFRAWLAGTTSSKASALRIGVSGGNPTDIEMAFATDEIIGIYNLEGQPLSEIGQGVNIVKYANGETKKIIIK